MTLALLLLGTCSVTALAEETDVSATVYVTISDAEGQLALAQEVVTVTDTDADGALTINDALYAAHEAKYEGGADAGYGSALTDYGLSMNKLWGAENGSGYGYYINNASAWSLTDPIKDGDYINAFVYTDITTWSDTYCFFDVCTANTTVGDSVTLNLSAAGYDAEYNPITVPVESAVITMNGAKTSYTTDANGDVTVPFEDAATFVLSAVSDTMTLVPPVCVVTVAASEVSTAPETTDAPEISATETVTAPQTGDGMASLVALAVSTAMLLTCVSISRKKVK